MVKTPIEIYQTENVDKDVAFYHTSSVRRQIENLSKPMKIIILDLFGFYRKW